MNEVVAQQTAEAVQYLQDTIPQQLHGPAVGIICGSGLNGLADTVLNEWRTEISYSDIPHFPMSTVHGHAGKLLFGLLESDGKPIVLMLGRVHYYEGHSIQKITLPIRVLKRLGVETIIVTNAAGGLNPEYAVGDLVVLHDHINLAGLAGIHPLRGPNVDDFGVRFPALSDAYDLDLRRRAHRLWGRLERDPEHTRKLHEGVYAFVGGPSYETRAECRLLHSMGADLVGMSTVPEIIVARHSNMRVLALSLVTNKAVLHAGPRGDDASIPGPDSEIYIEYLNQLELNTAIAKGKANHDEVLVAGQKAAKDVQQLVGLVVRDILKGQPTLQTTQSD